MNEITDAEIERKWAELNADDGDIRFMAMLHEFLKLRTVLATKAVPKSDLQRIQESYSSGQQSYTPMKAVPIGEGELPPLDEEYEREAAALKGLMPHGPLLLKLRAESRERQLLQSQQREREWHSIKEQALTKMEEQRKRAELAEARLRSQERPEDLWNRAVKAGSAAGSRGRILPPYTPPK